ncbi:MAG: FAD-dependent oxidoreductase [Balneolaceae bacterium]
MKKIVSFWEREEWLTPPDLLIIGAGIVGASTALFYKEKYPDHDVLIVDRGVTPEGASTRNAGFTCIGSISEHLADMTIAGEETVLSRIERRWNGLNLLKKTAGEKEISYEHTGGYEIFTDDTIFEKCREQMEVMNNHLEDRIGVKDVYKSTEYAGKPAIFNHLEGAINSGKLMRSLHQRLAKLGVRVWWNCKAESVNSGLVMLDNGLELHPKKIVIATNGFSSHLVDIGVKPARGFVFITDPIQDLKWKGTFNYNEGYVYFRNVGDRLLLGGGRDVAKEEETTDQFGTNQTIKSYLHKFANEVLNIPKGWKVDMEWSGIMGVTENKEPIIEELKPGLFVAAGLSGMGIAIGMQVAKDLCKKMKT